MIATIGPLELLIILIFIIIALTVLWFVIKTGKVLTKMERKLDQDTTDRKLGL
ncbi:hypothetical protein [Corynebacterium spheniscorum]|uniref:Uncharacterized protein n=1 Tax=Corynebacterium spheniscorum TaxID=185761 RepID=A0A1I2UY40_9CORY|nr:hypothetical protein [Corynebacterium spheniscorum]SFG79791.1 hypothetical protein SAMN05660282_01993 [Corynebacterium spheniscorum]